MGEGSILDRCQISHSIIGLRSRIAESAVVEDSIVMGADFYQSIEDIEQDKKAETAPIGIGKGCIIKKAIIDKNVRIGDGSKIVNRKGLDSFESDTYTIKDGIIIIPKNTTIPTGTVI